MTSTSPATRAQFINGLRDLASFLGAHIGFPVPEHSATILVFPDGESDDERRAVVDQLAGIFGVTAEEDYGHYTAERCFGPVAYRAVAISDAARARHAAGSSYYDSVTPDQPGGLDDAA